MGGKRERVKKRRKVRKSLLHKEEKRREDVEIIFLLSFQYGLSASCMGSFEEIYQRFD